MRELRGDIWQLSAELNGYVVVPTNLEVKRDGCAIMGAGLAKQAMDLFPSLPLWYGTYIRREAFSPFQGWWTPVFQDLLLLFPTKMQWREPADLGLIESSARALWRWADAHVDFRPIFVPAVGCGLGGLTVAQVRPILERYLVSNRFIFVEQA